MTNTKTIPQQPTPAILSVRCYGASLSNGSATATAHIEAFGLKTVKDLEPLILNSPIMLDALKDAEQEIENMLEDLCQSEGPEADTSAQKTLATIRAAIAAAEGRS